MANPKPNISGLINYRLRKALGIISPKPEDIPSKSGKDTEKVSLSQGMNDLIRRVAGIDDNPPTGRDK